MLDCIEARDCLDGETCYKNACINPCSIQNVCGQNTKCTVVNHNALCSCLPSYSGGKILIKVLSLFTHLLPNIPSRKRVSVSRQYLHDA